MNNLIAFCENTSCGTVFEYPNLIGGEGSATIHMTNTKVGPCPKCGSVGIVPDGVYKYANNVIDFLTGPSSSIEVLKKIESILKNAKKGKHSKEEVLAEIEKTSPDTAQALKDVSSGNTLIQWLMLIFAIITVAIQVHTSYFKKDTNLQDKVIEYLLDENNKLQNNTQTYKKEGPIIQRNDPCPCGSGKKYEKCCGLTSI